MTSFSTFFDRTFRQGKGANNGANGQNNGGQNNNGGNNAAAGGNNNANGNTNANGGGNNDGNNNTGSNTSFPDNIWVKPVDPNANANGGNNANGNGGNNNSGGQNNGQNGNANGGVDPNKQFKDYLMGLNLRMQIPQAALDAFKQDGDVGKLMGSIQDASQEYSANILQRGYMDMSRMVDNAVQRAVTEAVGKTRTEYQGTELIKQMESTLEFTKNPNISPVARGILSQMLKLGATPVEAVDGVKQFFIHTAKLSAKDLGLNTNNTNQPGGMNLQNGQNGEQDWGEFFGNLTKA